MGLDQLTIICLALTAGTTLFNAILLNRIADDVLKIRRQVELEGGGNSSREAESAPSSNRFPLLEESSAEIPGIHLETQPV